MLNGYLIPGMFIEHLLCAQRYRDDSWEENGVSALTRKTAGHQSSETSRRTLCRAIYSAATVDNNLIALYLNSSSIKEKQC